MLEGLDAGFEADDVADILLQARIQPDQEVDRALFRAIDLVEPGLQQRPGGLDLAERGDLLGQRRIVGEGPLLGGGLEEEVERIGDRHVGHEVDRDLELARLLRDHQAREVVALRILLPVDEVLRRLDLERIGQDRRAAVRRRAQSHDLRTQRNQPVVRVGRPVVKGDVYAHLGLLTSGSVFRSYSIIAFT